MAAGAARVEQSLNACLRSCNIVRPLRSHQAAAQLSSQPQRPGPATRRDRSHMRRSPRRAGREARALTRRIARAPPGPPHGQGGSARIRRVAAHPCPAAPPAGGSRRRDRSHVTRL
eukprot:scaffold2156_cov32-Tisochrysis_lutea.AAC.2